MDGNHTIRAVLAQNLRMLMDRRDPPWTQEALAKKAGVVQRTISNMLRGADDEVSGSTLDRVAAVARVFGLQSWHLTYPDLPDIIDDIHSVTDVLTGFRLADKDGRAVIHSVAEREAKYRTNPRNAA